MLDQSGYLQPGRSGLLDGGVVSRNFRKMVCRPWHERSQPAMEASSRAASRCFMFMYFLLPHWVPATWRSRAQTSMRAELQMCIRDRSSWVSFFQWLRGRGLDGVKLVVGDKCLGMLEAVGEVFPEAKYQRCTVHLYRNVFSVTPRSKVKLVAKMLKAIHAYLLAAIGAPVHRRLPDSLPVRWLPARWHS